VNELIVVFRLCNAVLIITYYRNYFLNIQNDIDIRRIKEDPDCDIGSIKPYKPMAI